MQMMSAKLGVATGRHLAEHARENYPIFPRMVLWVLVELGVIACDMIEVIGGAVALNTLSNGAVPLWAGVLITVCSAFGVLLLERAGMRILEAVLVALILTMGGTFFYMFFSTDVDYVEALKGGRGGARRIGPCFSVIYSERVAGPGASLACRPWGARDMHRTLWTSPDPAPLQAWSSRG